MRIIVPKLFIFTITISEIKKEGQYGAQRGHKITDYKYIAHYQ
ncbi:hypothetical protein SAMN02745246_01516 [Leeuwenhoekiella marinoflava DSM 3653]|uniref:Uncharacterized protein n=2 Tax=Leeuwenhoekiella marinoflava TaxID=988 RepID=A0A4Q0PNY5_9FLAO|nr:hypothetical protein DSL99_1666 [Leeuwenhoekiella marinoflava]SHF03057.1 hypothetical protein SAMN02745246_01516 [Leeuwenhoekiella marinoflava DSM 3653]